jgi:hypothetical protein
MDDKILEALIAAVERFPRLAGLLIGVILHPVLSAVIGR